MHMILPAFMGFDGKMKKKKRKKWKRKEGEEEGEEEEEDKQHFRFNPLILKLEKWKSGKLKVPKSHNLASQDL